MIMIPLKIYGSWESIAIFHMIPLMLTWTMYGLGAFDNSAD